MTDTDAAVERVAEAAHSAWSGWIDWMYEKWDQTHASGETFRDRWRRQAATPYPELSEAEKESDRIEARKYIAAMSAIVPPPVDAAADRRAFNETLTTYETTVRFWDLTMFEEDMVEYFWQNACLHARHAATIEGTP